jgi:hypothetical protein
MFFLSNFYGKFLDAAICERGSEISTDNFYVQQVVKKDMALEVTLLNTMIYGKLAMKKEYDIKRDKYDI